MSLSRGTGARRRVVCATCQRRHRKCNWEEQDDGPTAGDESDDAPSCLQCRAAGIACEPPATFRFRPYARQKALTRAAVYRPCPPPQAPLRFYDESADLHAIYHPADPDPDSASASASNSRVPPTGASMGSQASSPPNVSPLSPHNWSRPVTSAPAAPNCSPGPCRHHQHAALPSPTFVDSGTHNSADSLVDTPTSLNSQPTQAYSLTPTEAFLLRNFADRMAQWTDIADPFRTFEVEVSHRALTNPLIRYAVCAFSARHFYRCQKGQDGDAEALHWQNKCLQLLITAMSGAQPIKDSTLVAVALLRQNEEMDEHDNRFHLDGASRILNTVPEFAASGGIGEAACWLCLREEIYISLTSQTPIKIRLDCFLDSLSIRRQDDYSWASKSILKLAYLLNRVFQDPRQPEDIELSEVEIAEWNHLKPDTYSPVFYSPRSRRQGRCFPDIWMLAPHQALGLQYYHIAQIVLNAVPPQTTLRPYDYLATAGARQRRIMHHLYVVIGLAISNERAENTWFTARHCLSVWGAYVRHEQDQSAVLEFLHRWSLRSGWKTSALVDSLKREWTRDSQSD